MHDIGLDDYVVDISDVNCEKMIELLENPINSSNNWIELNPLYNLVCNIFYFK